MKAAPLDCPPIPPDAPHDGVISLGVFGDHSFVAYCGARYAVASDGAIYRVVVQNDKQMWDSDLKTTQHSEILTGLIALGYTLRPTWRGTQLTPPKQQIALDFGF